MHTKNEDLRQELLHQRQAKGISQFRLSQLSGISRYRISLFECGYLDLSDEEQARLLIALLPAAPLDCSGGDQ